MTLAEIVCTCGTRFSVADDGAGAAHACPSCKVQNVLPRVAPPGGLGDTGGGSARTHVASPTAVLSPGELLRLHAVTGLPAGTMFGPYRIVRRIAKGGMGSVYEAQDDRMGRRVALKVLSPELAQRSDFVARFHRESRALAGLADPRIAPVYFNGAAEGLPFFAMEYVEGRNLEEVIAAEGPLDGTRSCRLMIEVAQGLAAAAERGIIHRDVKPTNLLLDRAGRLKIVDFGLAKSIDSESSLTVTGAVVGTPFYLSPEQGLGKPVDQRADIYSLGATFYHLLTGAPPFRADSPVSVILRHVHEAPEALTRRNPKVPEPLARIVMRCLAKEPARRYQDYDELVADLEAALRGDPVTAPPESASQRRSSPSYVVVDDLDDGARALLVSSRLRRVFALTIDTGAVAVLGSLLDRYAGLKEMTGASAAAWLLPLAWLYLVAGDALGGRTLGKTLFRLRVARPDGRAPGPLSTALRGLLLLPVAALMVRLSGVDLGAAIHELASLVVADAAPGVAVNAGRALLALVLFDTGFTLLERRQRSLHDALSGTTVFAEKPVRRRKRKPAPTPARAEPVAPLLPAVMSVVPGLGQFLNGEPMKGLAFLFGVAVLLGSPFAPVGVLLWVMAAWDAWRTAKRLGG